MATISDPFDPYYTWLGIPPEEQPADYYRLLGIRRFENNSEVIANAVHQRETHLRTFESGPRVEHARQVLTEILQARDCLSVPESKRAYDQALRTKDAPKLSKNGGPSRPAPPPAPRRASMPSAPSPSTPVTPKAALEAAEPAPIYTPGPGELTPVQDPLFDSAPRPVAVPRAMRRSPLPLVWLAVAVVSVLMLAVVAIGGAIWGGMAILARVPIGNSAALDVESRLSFKNQGTISESGSVVTLRGIGPKGEIGAGHTMTLVVGESVDLLARLDRRRQVRPNLSLTREPDGWVSHGQKGYEVLAFPSAVPEQYLLDTTVVLLGESQGVIQGLPNGGRMCHVVVDGFQGERDRRGIRSALEIIDGRRPHDLNPYPCESTGSVLVRDRPAELRYVVLKDKVVVYCNGRTLLAWTGGMERVSTNMLFAAGNPREISWGTWQTKCRLSKCVLRPILEVQ